jgi:micrococcal nuclease
MMRRMCGSIGWWACLLLLLAQPAGATTNWTGKVTHVTDGDTLWVRPQRGGAPRAIRLDGIDAPELCQAHGEAARAALVGRVLGQTVQLKVRRHDDYGRALARVSLQGQDLGGWLVSRGHAWSYRYRGQTGPYAGQEARARQQGLGLHGSARAEAPWVFRRRHGSCH